jgi:hypothetical protein
MTALLTALIKRGDNMFIEKGRIIIGAPNSPPNSIKEKWIDSNRLELAREIANLTGDEILYFHSYKTGSYGKALAGGVTLQFVGLTTGRSFYTVFNVSLKRSRTTAKYKAGTPLPNGQFRTTKMSKFYRYWLTTGLKTPPRLSTFYDYMGNLKKVLFIANIYKGNRLDKDTIQPYNLSYKQLKNLILPDIIHTTDIQEPYNIHTGKPYKLSSQTQSFHSIHSKPATSEDNYGIRTQGNTNIRVRDIPQDNANYEWLKEYRDNLKD